MVEAAEVVVTLGDSIVSVTRVERGSAYWFGTAHGSIAASHSVNAPCMVRSVLSDLIALDREHRR